MTIYIKNHDFKYEIENLCRVFFQNEKLVVTEDLSTQGNSENYVYTEQKLVDGNIIMSVEINIDGNKVTKEQEVPHEEESECERILAVILFEVLSEITGVRPPWGILTGVRPIKLMRRLVNSDGEEKATKYFKDSLLVSDKKTKFSLATMRAEQKILDLSENKSYSLYVSIPFCPTRCSYCSFVSQSVEKSAKLIPQYVDLLCKELEYTAQIAKNLGLKLETVYIGGGTPTTLSAEQLSQLIEAINNNFDMSSCREFTVEAGRPDTITPEKLRAIKNGGVTRISINPQTLNDDILSLIGRKHSSRQTIDAFNLARECGFDNINMDLIAGLPSESYESFVDTLTRINELGPESITIHTLAMKRSSGLTAQGKNFFAEDSKRTSDMLDFATELLYKNKYEPYYLYRQSRMVGNLENVGWAKKGYEGLYNVYIMDETHSILACGAGAVTKLKSPNSDYIERIFNFKFPYEYIAQFEEMIERKKQVSLFYDEL